MGRSFSHLGTIKTTALQQRECWPFSPFLSRLCWALKLLQLLLFQFFPALSPRLLWRENHCLSTQQFFESPHPKVNVSSSCRLLESPVICPYTNTSIRECCYILSSIPQFCDLVLTKKTRWLVTSVVTQKPYMYLFLFAHDAHAFINHYPKSFQCRLIPGSVRQASEQGTGTPRDLSETSSIRGTKM